MGSPWQILVVWPVLGSAMDHIQISRSIWRCLFHSMIRGRCFLVLDIARMFTAAMPKSFWGQARARRVCHLDRGSCTMTSLQAVMKLMYNNTARAPKHSLICVAQQPFRVCHKPTTGINWISQENKAAYLVHWNNHQHSTDYPPTPLSHLHQQVHLISSTTSSLPTLSSTTSTTTQ